MQKTIELSELAERRRRAFTVTDWVRAICFICILFAAIFCGGCAYVHQEFMDADGTQYSYRGWVPPFGAVAKNAGNMGYKWNASDGDIKMGLSSEGVDNTAQADALRAMLETVNAALALAASRGVAVP